MLGTLLSRVGNMGTGDKEEVMVSREVWVGDQKARINELMGTDEGTGCS